MTNSSITIQESSNNVYTQNIFSRIFETLSMLTKQQFTDIFFTSIFDINVNDTFETPYFIDMIVEPEDYLIVISLVNSSRDSSDTIINQILFQS